VLLEFKPQCHQRIKIGYFRLHLDFPVLIHEAVISNDKTERERIIFNLRVAVLKN
jgi:hypothetical protein